jgi:cytochrome c biogenesis protein CcmG/thiol:disulfide interchange protein DsbE
VAALTLAVLASSAVHLRAADPASAARLDALKLQTTEGAVFPMGSLRGKVVVLDFWAPWCMPCRASFPFLDGLEARHRAAGLVVVGLTLDKDSDGIFRFLESVPVGFPIARDPSGAAGEAFGVVAMPTTFLIDREGRVAARFEGGASSVHERLEAASQALLAGKPLPEGTDVRVAKSLQATSDVKAWQRGYLADPIMSLDGDALTRTIREHVHASKEGAAGDGGASGGGCGCN